jgi:hypothetical protein
MASKDIEDLYTSLTTPYLQGTCKDCGNGTLNNDLNPAFTTDGTDELHCMQCGSSHVDIL